MTPLQALDTFLNDHHLTNEKLLLGLSGGPDSLCLFHCLLTLQKKYPFHFHVVHVDHGWRFESKQEAMILQKLCMEWKIPFHLKVLQPEQLTGNLEAACRLERYVFFKEISSQYHLKGVLVGHQKDDQAETVLKRIFEGAHWSKWGALVSETVIYDLVVFRPFLKTTKREILDWLKSRSLDAFEDATNGDSRFLRGRMRQTLIPALNLEFGKSIQNPLIEISHQAQELNQYFEEKVKHLWTAISEGPFGIYIDFSSFFPLHALEIKYFIRQLCGREGFVLSRPILESAVHFLVAGCANKTLMMGNHHLLIDRHRLFLVGSLPAPLLQSFTMVPGCSYAANWKIEVALIQKPSESAATSWKDGWKGIFCALLPMGSYRLAFGPSNAPYLNKANSISKWWTDHKVPAFLRSSIPVIWKEDKIYHEFLTGSSVKVQSNESSWLEVRLRTTNQKKTIYSK